MTLTAALDSAPELDGYRFAGASEPPEQQWLAWRGPDGETRVFCRFRVLYSRQVRLVPGGAVPARLMWKPLEWPGDLESEGG